MKPAKKGETIRALARYQLGQWSQNLALLALIEAGSFLFTWVLMAVLYAVTGDVEALTVGVPGMLAMIVVMFMGLAITASGGRVQLQLGVQMGMTRRGMLVSSILGGLCTQLVTVLLAVGLELVWRLTVKGLCGLPTESILNYIPAWGWAALVYLPVCAGMTAGIVTLRFGRRGFWVMYALFMLACLGPSLFGFDLPEPALDGILTAAPLALPAAGLVLLAADWAMLRRANVG